MFHCNGWCSPGRVAAVGATHACLRRIDPPRIWRLVRRRASPTSTAPQPSSSRSSNDPAAKTAKLARKLTVSHGRRAALPTYRAVQELGAEIIHVYGLTETYGPHTVCEWPSGGRAAARGAARRKARQGVAYVIADDVRVVDEQMQDVPRTARRWARSSCAATTS